MKKILLTCLMLVFVLHAWAQDRTVSGKVTDADTGEGLPGVNVLLKGTSTGVNTDLDGNYKISVPSDGGTLVFTFIGMAKSEVSVGSRSVIDVQMETDVQQLSEVVVTAFGLEREKKSLGYAVQDVSGSEITTARETNVVNSLSGKIAGVQITNGSGAPGSSSRVVLRGATSLTGNNQPLFVVDGIPINNTNYGNAGPFGGADAPNGAADINPDDIETISVLKGANAAALYGSRAANGVILITTKSGKNTKGIGVEINSNITFQNPLRLPSYQNSYGGGYDNTYYEWIDGTNGSGGEDESWGPALDAGLKFRQFQDYQGDGQFGEPSDWVSRPNNVRDFFETGVTATNNVSLTGGNETSNFRLSMTNLNQDGMVYNTDLVRNTIAGNAGVQLTDKFRADFSVNYIKSGSDNLSGGGYDNNNPMQQFTWFQRQVDISALKDYKNLPTNSAATSARFTPLNWNTNFNNNPYWVLDNNTQSFEKNRLIGNIKLQYDFTDWLSLTARTGTDFFTDLQESKRAVNSNDFPNGFYQEVDRTWSETNSDIVLTFDKNIIEDFGVSVSVGGNLRQEQYDRNTLEAGELEIPEVYTISNSAIPVVGNNYEEQREMQSVYGTAQFRFRNYLFLDLTARNDWSSTLPEGNNSYFYPSASLSAVISDMIEIDRNILTFAKVRGSWAQVGSDTDPYRLQDVFAFRDRWDGSINQATVSNTLLNPNLRPELTTSIEFGTDVRFFNDRLGLDFTYYDTKSEDLIVQVDVSGASGWTSQFANVGEMTTKGIEIQLNATPVQIGDFRWDMNLNYSTYENKVVSLGGVDNLRLGGQWNVDVMAIPGQPYPALFGPDYQRDPNGNIIHGENGLPQKDQTNKVLGDAVPDWTGGWNNSFTYKGINLNVLVDAKIGGEIYSMTNAWGRYAGILEETLKGRENGIVGEGVIEVSEGVYEENNVVVPALNYNHAAFGNNIAAGSVFDASYVKLRQITLGYSLPKAWIQNTPFRGVQVSAVGRNLALLYAKAPHIDPETAFNNGNAQGIEHAQLPSARSIGFNVNLKF
ncbi:SusC/RagA family TonB-linked outer membrane protein [Marivirga sp. S37H4]|uniref:SusC/RagA family TonB-linked outer membrane protein n=1 Tax=Marivirga aurantiaca TaxID=2802615 RepID=A0A934WV18_9BACT|nr:SusC/RagA family TonB-linked outer membrane protein [Marivirga aurantiaca]MBK6263461.1 SusC/RagA family TonB-linked outer membrane protein [Marivirga aurantiaca]